MNASIGELRRLLMNFFDALVDLCKPHALESPLLIAQMIPHHLDRSERDIERSPDQCGF